MDDKNVENKNNKNNKNKRKATNLNIENKALNQPELKKRKIENNENIVSHTDIQSI